VTNPTDTTAPTPEQVAEIVEGVRQAVNARPESSRFTLTGDAIRTILSRLESAERDTARLDTLESSWPEGSPIKIDLVRDWKGTWRATLDYVAAQFQSNQGKVNDD